MAIRPIAQLKAWFKRGAYPTAEQFADWLDSYFHKEEKVPVASVDGLAERLNAKYDQTAGEELERKHNALQAAFDQHETENEINFANVDQAIDELEAVDEDQQAQIDTIRDTLGANPYMVDAQYSSDGTRCTVTYSKFNAKTGLTGFTMRSFPVVTEANSGAMTAEAYNALVRLLADVEALKNQGGRFIGVSFATKAALDAYVIPAGVNVGDFTYVDDDETHDGSTTRYIAALENGAMVFRFGYIINFDPVGLATLERAGLVRSSTLVGKVLVEADGTMSVVGWDALKASIDAKIAAEQQRSDAALASRITQTKNEVAVEIAALRQLLVSVVAESQGRVIPLVMNLTPPSKITIGNTVKQYIKAELLPSFTVPNILFLGDGKSVDVEPDGAVTVLGLGKSHVHVIPTENTSLHQAVEIEVVEPGAVTMADGGCLLVGDGMLLT